MAKAHKDRVICTAAQCTPKEPQTFKPMPPCIILEATHPRISCSTACAQGSRLVSKDLEYRKRVELPSNKELYRSVQAPTKFLLTRWTSDPHSLGRDSVYSASWGRGCVPKFGHAPLPRACRHSTPPNPRLGASPLGHELRVVSIPFACVCVCARAVIFCGDTCEVRNF
jgi:hypothetical protein